MKKLQRLVCVIIFAGSVFGGTVGCRTVATVILGPERVEEIRQEVEDEFDNRKGKSHDD